MTRKTSVERLTVSFLLRAELQSKQEQRNERKHESAAMVEKTSLNRRGVSGIGISMVPYVARAREIIASMDINIRGL
jgi:hypothetical protein